MSRYNLIEAVGFYPDSIRQTMIPDPIYWPNSDDEAAVEKEEDVANELGIYIRSNRGPKLVVKIIGSGKRRGRNNRKYKRWRLGVFERDGWKCQGCGRTSDLEAHHIESWVENYELRYDVSNGITYCESCHVGIHKKERMGLVNV